MTEQAFELAKALGHVGAGDEKGLRALCAQAGEELRLRLREGVTEADCGGALPLSTAWLALAGLCAGDAAGGVESFTAGSVSIRKGPAGDGARRAALLRAQAERAMRPYLRDEAFSFLGVR